MKKKPKSFIILSLLLVTVSTYSQEYKLHPKAALELGKGIDLRRIEEGKVFSLFKTLEPKWENPVGTPATNVFEDVITTEEEYEKSLGIDVNINARYMGASLDASYNLNRKEILNSSSITLLFTATSDFGRQTLQNITFDNLNDDPKNLINQGKYIEFVQQYGNYFVFAVRRTIGINIYLTLTSTSKQKKEKITAQIKGGYTSGPGTSVSASVNINTEVFEANKQGRIRINLQSNGDTTGFAGVRNLIRDALNKDNPYDKISATLEKYMGQFSRSSSIITTYYLTPMTNLRLPREYIQWDEATNARIVDLSKQYKSLLEIQTNYETLKANSMFNSLATDDEKNSLQKTIVNINRELYHLSKRKDSCLFECQTNENPYDCCNYEFLYYKENDVFKTYWAYYNILNHEYNYPKSFSRGENYELINIKIPPLKSKKVKITFKYALDYNTTPPTWGPSLVATGNLIVNDKKYPFRFWGKNGFPPTIFDDDGVIMIQPELFDVISTDAIILDKDDLRVSFSIDDFNMPYTNGQNIKVRLVPKNNIKVEVLE